MRYAKALLSFAAELHEDEQAYAEMSALSQAFVAVPALHQAMLNPMLPEADKFKLLLTAACGDKKPSKSLERFLQLVLANGRASAMLFIAHSLGTLYRRTNHIINGKLVVPAKVGDELIARLQQVVENRSQCKVDFEVEVDPAIQGGFILSYDTYRLDASLRTELSRLRRELSR